MLCQNCGKNEVNFHYTQVINGVKKEIALCDKCAKELGFENLDFNIPIDFSNFLGNFLEESLDASEPGFLPNFMKTEDLVCKNCGMTYQDFVNTGKFGCSHCYDIFQNKLDSTLKKLHGSSNHLGRNSKFLGKVNKKIEKQEGNKENTVAAKNTEKTEKTRKTMSKEEKLDALNKELKKAISEERYEDAAKIRDKIKGLK